MTYLSINLVKEDKERNEWTIQELAKPIASFHIYIGEKTAKIVIENAGLGPLIINKLKIISSNNQQFDEFKSIIDKVREISYRPETTITKTVNKTIVKKEGFFTILDIDLDRLTFKKDQDEFDMNKKISSLYKVKNELSTYKILLEYSDMYGNRIEEITESLEGFSLICK